MAADEKQIRPHSKQVEEALIRLEHALLNQGLWDEAFVLELQDRDFRRLFWPRPDGIGFKMSGPDMGRPTPEPREAYTTDVVRFGRFEIRRRK